jgi:amino acid adenylation domain-containing protein
MKNRRYSDKAALAANQNVRERKYWLNRLSADLEKSQFPVDFFEDGRETERTEVVEFGFSPGLSARAMKVSGGVDIKLHMLLLAGLTALVYRTTGTRDILIGSPVLKQEVEADFINTALVFRSQVQAGMNFKELLLQVRQTVVEATDNQNFPLEVLPDLGLPLFDIALLLESIHSRHYLQNFRYSMLFSFSRSDARLSVTIEYNGQLYERKNVERLANCFFTLLEAGLSNGEVPLDELDMLSEAEKRRVLIDFNNTGDVSMGRLNVVEMFADQAARTPGNTAVVVDSGPATGSARGQRSISYEKLAEKSGQLAGRLVSMGVTVDSIAAVLVEPSIEMMVGLLGILKAGAAYLPIDTDIPPERIRYILNDSGAELLLTCGDLADGLAMSCRKIDLTQADIYTTGTSGSDIAVGLENLAYVIYTSGTTGRPKGVLVSHGNLLANLTAFFQEFHIQAADTVIQLGSYAFDAFVEEVFPALLRGGKIAIPSRSDIVDMPLLTDFINRHGVTLIDCTPLLLNEFNRLNNLESVHTFISGGDVLKAEYVSRLKDKGNVYNTYGPTEATVCTTYYKYSGTGAVKTGIPIGKPIANYRVYILDKNFNPLPIGAKGEIMVAGPGVTRGYLNKPELTADKFVDLAAKTREETRSSKNEILTPKSYILYRTGDLARWRPDGSIEFSGRLDQQVKIRGYRIELGDIESKLLEHVDIEDAVVLEGTEENRDKYLCAYIVGLQELTVSGLREYLLNKLPDYMIPTYFVPLPKIPLTSNGKVDRKALNAYDVRLETGVEYVAPETETEKTVARVWQEVLKTERVGVRDNFFDIGGNSLKIITVNVRLREAYGRDIPVVAMFQYPTIESLARYLGEEAEGDSAVPQADRAETLHRGREDKLKRFQRRKGVNNG